MSKAIFITGTDTEVGKTTATLALMRCIQARGHAVVGMKPIASGAHMTAQGLVNDDALQLQAQGSQRVDYATLNPYVFAPPIAPHIAAAQIGVDIEVAVIRQRLNKILAQGAHVLVEGAGGWLVPLNARQSLADLVTELALPAILVVGVRLGCINHALLTVADMQRRGVNLLGWIANRIDPDCLVAEAVVDSLRERITAPCIGDLAWQGGAPAGTAEETLDPAPVIEYLSN